MKGLPRLAIATLLALALTVAARPQSSFVAPAKSTGPLPVTADSFPFLADDRTLGPADLRKHGYIEQEFTVSGTANIYDWAADGTVSVLKPNVPYTTRILVRRPADPQRFSGAAVVELLHAGRRYDWSMMWGYSRDSFIERGDAWVGVTLPGAVTGLKKFDPKRYAALSFANPTPTTPCPGGGDTTLSDTEEGLRWDAISQIGALLKTSAAAQPFAGLRVQAIYMTMQSADVMTYITAIHPQAKLENGKPVYDGYLVKSPLGSSRIHRCATAPDRNDPRQKIRNVGVPVIAVMAQGDVIEALPLRRPDSDAPNDRYRSYEVAGASHIDKAPYRGLPILEDQTRAGNAQGSPEWPFATKCDPDIPLTELPILGYAFNAAFRNLDNWVRKGTAPPRAEPIALAGSGGSQTAIALDAHGNGRGGVRSPYVDVPAATYFTTSPGPGTCRELGRQTSFDLARMDNLYGNRSNYIKKIEASVERLIRDRWLTEPDGKRIRESAKEKNR